MKLRIICGRIKSPGHTYLTMHEIRNQRNHAACKMFSCEDHFFPTDQSDPASLARIIGRKKQAALAYTFNNDKDL